MSEHIIRPAYSRIARMMPIHDASGNVVQPVESDEPAAISVCEIGGHWRVLENGKICKTITGRDAGARAVGYALAMTEKRLR